MVEYTLLWAASLFVTHFASLAFFSTTEHGSIAKNAASIAQQICYIATGLVLTGLALQAWFFSQWHDEDVSGTAQLRLHSSAPVFDKAKRIVEVSLAFQLYDLIVFIVRPSVRSWLMLSNRLVTSYLCAAFLYPKFRFFSDEEGSETLPKEGEQAQRMYAPFYAAFFLGLSETTTIPLAVYNALRLLEKRAGELSPSTRIISSLEYSCKILFPILLIFIRCFWWPFEAVRMWTDCAELEVQYRYSERYGVIDPRSSFSMVFILMGLDLLQLFWAVKICRVMFSVAKASGTSMNTIEEKSSRKTR